MHHAHSVRRALILAATAALPLACATERAASSNSASPAGARAPEAPEMEPDPTLLRPGDVRRFRATYTAKVEGIPAGTKTLRIWVPVPQSSGVQEIGELRFEGERQPELRREPRFGNRIAFFEVAAPPERFEATYAFVCTRREVLTDLGALADEGSEAEDLELYLEAERLVVIDDRIRALADEATRDAEGTVEQARAIYDHVAAHMTYDKSGTGWGRGDTVYACDVGRGNCTDFHALFISMCRAKEIAAGFEIGLYLPYERGSDEPLGGYHCWAWFRVPGRTWVPVDISEADRSPERLDYFFGAHTSNRVTLSAGRDIVLDPPQAGEPLNFFLAPYAEADGVPVSGVSKTWTAEDLDASG